MAGVCGSALKKAQAEEERLKSELETMDVGDLDASFLSDDDDTAGEQAGNTVQEEDDTPSNSTHTSHSTQTDTQDALTKESKQRRQHQGEQQHLRQKARVTRTRAEREPKTRGALQMIHKSGR